MKAVIIEDTDEVVESIELCISIRWPNSTIVATTNGNDGIRVIQRDRPDVVLLDLTLTDGSGLEVLRGIRLFSDVPIIVVSARADEATRVKGFELGADDYLVKPFSHTELLARVQAVLRRVNMTKPSRAMAVIGDQRLKIDVAAGRVSIGNKEVDLSATEWRLLAYLARNAGRVVSLEAFAANVWGLKYVDRSTVKMFIRRLRLKLGDDTKSPTMIRSHRGRGYSLELHH